MNRQDAIQIIKRKTYEKFAIACGFRPIGLDDLGSLNINQNSFNTSLNIKNRSIFPDEFLAVHDRRRPALAIGIIDKRNFTDFSAGRKGQGIFSLQYPKSERFQYIRWPSDTGGISFSELGDF